MVIAKEGCHRMRTFLIAALVILISFSLIGCCCTESGPVNSKNYQRYYGLSKTYGLGYECVWESVVQVFEQNSIPIKSIDGESGIIVSLDQSLPSKDQEHSGIFNAEDFDCGEPGGFEHFSRRTGTFTVIVKKRDDLTTVQVEASCKALVGDSIGQGQWRNCSSNGNLEDRFLELQGQNISSAQMCFAPPTKKGYQNCLPRRMPRN
jgi:hypothetical protein